MKACAIVGALCEDVCCDVAHPLLRVGGIAYTDAAGGRRDEVAGGMRGLTVG